MTKRELESSDVTSSQETPTKRQKEDSGQDQDVSMSDLSAAKEMVDVAGANPGKGATVKGQGLYLWNIIKNAVSKDGRVYSVAFMRKPPKRQYPDYYQLIGRPIALEDIKKQLDNGTYSSLEGVKEDLNLCFGNAKKYNMKDSDIWKDAKHLQKLVNKEYGKMTGENDNTDVATNGREKNADRDGGDDDGDDDGKKNKNKPPNMNRLLKTRLQRLVNKTDDNGRVLSTEFMELPSKKDWPMYYKEIKRPQCLENIFKHIKRREYLSCSEFAADVELVFSNALTFNMEHTAIWEDALTLRDYFRQLMADLPEPYTLPEYSKPSHGKIKLKMPAAQNTTVIAPAAAPQTSPSSGSVVLRVPGSGSTTQAQNKVSAPSQASPSQSSISIPAKASTTAATPSAPKLAQPQPTHANPSTFAQTSTQPASYSNSTYSTHYPNASYQASHAAERTLGPIIQTSNGLLVQTTSYFPRRTIVSLPSSPTPTQPNYLLKHVYLRTEPHGRPFKLDHKDGVKTWVMRLSPGEQHLCVTDIKFLGDEEEESGMEETPDERDVKEEEEEETEAESVLKNGKKKSKAKGKGRHKNASKAAGKTKSTRSAKKAKPKMEEVQVKLNGVVAKESEEHAGEWRLDLLVGGNTIEIGEKGGLIWKVQAERLLKRDR